MTPKVISSLALVLVAACSSVGKPAGSPPPEPGTSLSGDPAVAVVQAAHGAASKPCQTAAGYSDRWQAIAGGGPSIGAITLSLGHNAMDGVVSAPATNFRVPDGWRSVKLLILVDAKPGQILVAAARRVGDDAAGRFTHGMDAQASEPPQVMTVKLGRPASRNTPPPIDLPGALLVPGQGCYAIFLALDGRLYGPFGLRV